MVGPSPIGPPGAASGLRRVVLAAAACTVAAGTLVGGCGRPKDSSFDLRLRPDASCQNVPLSCVDRLAVELTGDAPGAPRQWDFSFQVPGGSAPLDDLPTRGTGQFRVAGMASSGAVAFTGTSGIITFSSRDQGTTVDVSCAVPPPCATPDPSPTPTPFADFQDAALVLGQENFLRCDGGNMGDDEELEQPEGVLEDPARDRLWISEWNANRIAVFGGLATLADAQPLAFAVGQTNFGNTGTSDDPDRCNRPTGIGRFADTLVFADQQNHRAPVFTPVPSAFGASSVSVLGQTANDAQQSPNQGGAADASTLNTPWGVATLGSAYVFVADSQNHRILRYDATALANDLDADLVLGQADFTSTQANRGGAAGAGTLSSPAHLATDGTRLYVADRGNNRVLVWLDVNGLVNGADADLVLGQPDFATTTPNTGGIGASSMQSPRGVAATADRLVVADSGNHRVLVWQPPPAANGAPATQVLGQTDFTTGDPNHGQAAGTCGNVGDCNLGQNTPSAATLTRPGAVWISGDRLWVADTCNHRALLFVPPSR